VAAHLSQPLPAALPGASLWPPFGIFHGLWFLGLWQSVSHVAYVWVSAFPDIGHLGVYAASFSESYCSGLGTAALPALLMSACKKEYSATQYALLSTLFRVTGIIPGSLSGWMADKLGYANYFALTFFLLLPVFAFILMCEHGYLRIKSSNKEAQGTHNQKRIQLYHRG